MVNRRRDQRRRRVVLDEVAGKSSTTGQSSHDGETSRDKNTLYAQGALRHHHARTSDLFPKRPWALVWTAMGLAVAIGCLNAIDGLSDYLVPHVEAGRLEPLRLGYAGSIASWYSSVLLIVAALTSIQIFSMRRHRNDDYRGSYRIWIWLAGVFLAASIVEVTQIGQVATSTLLAVTEWSPEQLFWGMFVGKVALLLGLVVRAYVEMGRSRGASIMLALAATTYLASTVLTVPAVQSKLTFDIPLIQGNLVVVGHSLLLLTLVVYLRFVYLQAHGVVLSAVRSGRDSESINETAETTKRTWSQRWGQWRVERAEAKAEKRQARQARRAAKQQERSERRAAKAAAKAAGKKQAQEQAQKQALETPLAAADAKPLKQTKSVTSTASKSTEKRTKGAGPLANRIKSREQAAAESVKSEAPHRDQSNASTELSAEELEQLENEILALSDKPKLSKSERRRLKKLQRRYERAA